MIRLAVSIVAHVKDTAGGGVSGGGAFRISKKKTKKTKTIKNKQKKHLFPQTSGEIGLYFIEKRFP